MKEVETVSTVYAKALLGAAEGAGVRDEVRAEVESFGRVLQDDAHVRRFVENPRMERFQKMAAIERALGGRVSQVFLHFLLVAVKKGRAAALGGILDAFLRLYDERVGIVRASVASAVPLDAGLLEPLRQSLASQLRKQVVFKSWVDPQLLGGIVVRFDGRVADSSLKSALSAVRSRMLAKKFGSQIVHEN
jgi:F-type H+-transporting ATPase subunit delta